MKLLTKEGDDYINASRIEVSSDCFPLKYYNSTMYFDVILVLAFPLKHSIIISFLLCILCNNNVH